VLACKQSADLFLPCNTDLPLGSGKPRKKVGRRNEPEALKVALPGFLETRKEEELFYQAS